MQNTQDHETMRPGEEETRKLTSFPSEDFLTRAVLGLQVMSARHIGLIRDHRALQRRHAPAGPQAPHAA